MIRYYRYNEMDGSGNWKGNVRRQYRGQYIGEKKFGKNFSLFLFHFKQICDMICYVKDES